MSTGLLTQGSANLLCPRVLGARPNIHALILLSEDNIYLLCELEKKTGPHVENNTCVYRGQPASEMLRHSQDAANMENSSNT